MLASLLHAGHQENHFRLLDCPQADYRQHLGLAFCERSGLVDHQRVDLLQ